MIFIKRGRKCVETQSVALMVIIFYGVHMGRSAFLFKTIVTISGVPIVQTGLPAETLGRCIAHVAK